MLAELHIRLPTLLCVHRDRKDYVIRDGKPSTATSTFKRLLSCEPDFELIGPILESMYSSTQPSASSDEMLVWKLVVCSSDRLPELRRACGDPEDYNPKLIMLEDILLGVVEKNQASGDSWLLVHSVK